VHRVEVSPSGELTPLQDRRSLVPQLARTVRRPGRTIVPDFPLANKSFNLSYAGNDL